MTLAGEVSERTLAKVLDRFPLQEQTGADGGAYLPLPGPMPGSGGVCRVWEGDGLVQRIVYVGIAFPPAQLDSHMIFAFGNKTSAVPHFTLDSIAAPGMFAYHLDLIPRVDLGASLAYMTEVYSDLTDAYEEGRKMDGLTEAALSPVQHSLMSPWMLASRADEPAFRKFDDFVNTYFEAWAKIADKGVSAEATAGLTADDFVKRDQAHRDMIFNADVDPVWAQITPIIGEEAAARIMEILRGLEL